LLNTEGYAAFLISGSIHNFGLYLMDFADAVYRADFEVYRIDGKKRFRLLPKP
jgi:hypothetical protein